MTNSVNAEQPSRNIDGKFKNSEIEYSTGISNIWEMTKEYMTIDRKDPSPTDAVPLFKLSKQDLLEIENDSIIRLGHSTILMKLDDQFVIADPVMSDRASPVQWAGPKRFHANPIEVNELPDILAVIISHDHYDHLDKAALLELSDKVTQFVVPLKVGKRLVDWGVPQEKITELDWWESTQVSSIEFTATPSQHFSGRGLFDKDKTLWASWVIKSQSSSLFFSGDSGYFSGFKAIGDKYGPFDITMVETGAYNHLWKEIHMMPEESVQAHIDLQGTAMVPIHNGTFDLALHDWYEPFNRVTKAAAENNVTILTPMFGQVVDVKSPGQYEQWWLKTVQTVEIEQPVLSQ
jgi:L-ascorbate metabolism protein UlaG (beta-lactamase superfamily)